MKQIDSKVIPIDLRDVDTDLIIPAQFLKSTLKEGYGKHLFHNLKAKDAQFPTKLKQYKNCEIMVSRNNFGCGSSREHAVWALKEWGIKAIVATSFSDIFSINAAKNNLLLIKQPEMVVDNFILEAKSTHGLRLTIDIKKEAIDDHFGRTFSFTIDPFRKECLLKDMNDIDYLLSKLPLIQDYDSQAEQRFFDLSSLQKELEKKK